MVRNATQLPTHRVDLIVRPIGSGGRYVVKQPNARDYFHLGEQEHFLLMQLDGERDTTKICAEFEHKFADPLTAEDLDSFIEIAREQGLLQTEELGPESAESIARKATRRSKQSVLYWRKSLFDPDRFFSWLEPKIRLFWTPGFLIASAGSIVWAAMILWTTRQEVASSFAYALRWETLILAWLVMFLIGLLHEFAHGLTCKHFGGEVREIGFLLMYFMPCYYCNVSDAWLFREKSKRLWVTFAGGYFELLLWALAVFAWQITMPDTLMNYLAFIAVVACGVDTLFNLNPLIKLDGYYLLSDAMEIPNLRQRSFAYTMGWWRHLLWGGPRPESQAKEKFLLGFGLASWVYSLTFLTLMLLAMWYWLGDAIGVLGLVLVALLGIASLRALFSDLFREDFRTMISKRRGRTILWVLVISGLIAASLVVPWTETADGEFELQATTQAEIRAPVAGFLKSVSFDEGDRVYAEAEIVRLEIPDLESRLAQKQAELREAEAKLKLLKDGPRCEEVAQQKHRLVAVRAFRDVAARNLERQKQVLVQELIEFDKRIEECCAECDFTRKKLAMQENLQTRDAGTRSEEFAARRNYLVACAKRDQVKADRAARAALGTSLGESELAERETELAHEQAALALLEAGTRSEEIESAQAAVDRLREEISYLENQRSRLSIKSPVAGVVTTDRLKRKIGSYFEEGDLIGEVENLERLEVVIAIDEDQAANVELGQQVELKARSQPFDVFEVKVERIAPRAETGDVQSKVHIYCKLNDSYGRFRSGMTGYARVECNKATIASVLYKKCLRLIRTEFWW